MRNEEDEDGALFAYILTRKLGIVQLAIAVDVILTRDEG
jgi:hypothetical protein